ncbi:MAG TPA: hypothetical protein VFR47_25735 [Anaerolineales bacterium]|nr:hypothetical protein [Anaerolineales bacterium]
MKSFSILTPVLAQALVIALIIGACGARVAPQATPTPIGNATDIQNTMVAEFVTMLAAAIPTATLTPTATVTNTPAATATLPPMPTLGETFTAIPGGNSGTGVNTGDPCINKVLPASLEGETIRIRIDNPTRATLMLSVNLQQSGPQSQCGYRSYTLAPGESLVINDLVEGCYTLWAWNPDPDAYFIVTNGTSCLDTSNSWTFDISTSDIKLRP